MVEVVTPVAIMAYIVSPHVETAENVMSKLTSAKLQQIILIDLDVTCDTLFDNLFFNH